MGRPTVPMIEILKRHFDPTFEMLGELVATCPGSLWDSRQDGGPFWQQITHVLTGIHFWLSGIEEPFVGPDFGSGPVPDLGSMPDLAVPKDKVNGYLGAVGDEVGAFFRRVDENNLTMSSPVHQGFTHADLILTQLRHIQHHIGICNRMLQESGHPRAHWRGFGE